MNYIKALALSLEYIDDNIKKDLKPVQVCNFVGYSIFHYSRVFALCTGMTMMEYIRKRKLSLAARDLLKGKKVLAVAIEYGFNTHSGFTKAFKKQFNTSPKEYLLNMKNHVNYELLCNYGGTFMKPMIIEKPAFKVAGVGFDTHAFNGSSTKDMGAFWDIVYGGPDIKAHIYEKLQPKIFSEIGILTTSYSINDIVYDNDGKALYVLGVIVEASADTSGFVTVEVPPAKYAKFVLPPVDKGKALQSEQNEFSRSIREGWRYITEVWLPTSGYSIDEEKLDFEAYNHMASSMKTASMEFYIPVKALIR